MADNYRSGLIVLLAFLLLVLALALPPAVSAPSVLPSAHQLVTLEVAELLANPDVWVGETVRVVGDALVKIESEGDVYGVLYSGEQQIDIEWKSEVDHDLITIDGKNRVAITGVWSLVAADRYHLIVGE